MTSRARRGRASAWVAAGLLGLVGAALVGWLALERSGAVADADTMAMLRARAAAEPERVRPTEPPVEGRDEPFSLPEPEPPSDMVGLRDRAYQAALKAGQPRPAEAAFRAMVKAFVEHNRQFADAQAQAEGLTVEEVGELTAFGFMAQQMTRWPAVEEVLGHELDPDVRAAGEQLLHDTNDAFKAKMRSMVKSGATEPERRALIESTQASFRQAYFGITGMNDAGVEQLLAGDPNRSFPPGELPPPETLAEQAELPGPPPRRPDDPPDTPEAEPSTDDRTGDAPNLDP